MSNVTQRSFVHRVGLIDGSMLAAPFPGTCGSGTGGGSSQSRPSASPGPVKS